MAGLNSVAIECMFQMKSIYIKICNKGVFLYEANIYFIMKEIYINIWNEHIFRYDTNIY